MALLLMDGFDYVTDNAPEHLVGKWTHDSDADIDSGAGRISGQALEVGTGALVETAFVVTNPIHLGFAFKFDVTPSSTRSIVYLYHEGSINVSLRLNISSNLEVRRGATGTLLATSTNAFSTGTWYYIEFKTFISSTVGTIEVRVDGTSVDWVPPLTSLDTKVSSGAGVSTLSLVGQQTRWNFDDLIIFDTTGSRLNDFLGDCTIETLYPDAPGLDTDFTPLAGTNWEAVDDVIPDGDTTYVEGSVIGNTDRHSHGNIVGSPDTIHAVAVNAHCKKTNAGVRTIRLVAEDGTTEGESADKTPVFGTYGWLQGIFADHPTGAAVWTESEVNTVEFGFKIET